MNTNPTSSFLLTKLFCINEIAFFLVTIGLGPCVPWLDDVGGDVEVAVELLDVGIGCRRLADAQA